jgi:hypothetical protein
MGHRLVEGGDGCGGVHRTGVAHDEQITAAGVEEQLHRQP